MNDSSNQTIGPGAKNMVIGCALVAIFLGALDALVMSAAMPTIVSDLGGLDLYAWAFSAYFLARAVSLPIFGKLADLYGTRNLYTVSIVIFLAASIWAGLADSMEHLIGARALQGVGAGGNFALAYILLSEISSPEERGKTLSLGSFVWGVASVLGPSFGGIVVNYVSWRWIFYINIPLSLITLWGIRAYYTQSRTLSGPVRIDLAGAFFMTLAIISLLTAFMLAGKTHPWISLPVLSLLALSAFSTAGFIWAEKRAESPILSVDFFTVPGFSLGNAAVFAASVCIFSLSAFSPLFIQGALGQTPVQVGLAMMSLSLAWSMGALVCGRTVNRIGKARASIAGGVVLAAGAMMPLFFSGETPVWLCVTSLGLAGGGIGFVSVSTLLMVQNSLPVSDLGVATSVHQFSRTLGGTIGIGISGGLLTSRFAVLLNDSSMELLPPDLAIGLKSNLERLFEPAFAAKIPQTILENLQSAVAQSLFPVFVFAFASSAICIACALWLRNSAKGEKEKAKNSSI